MRTIDSIIIHCADTFANMDIGVEEIREWHKARGWKDVGYHYVIRRDGQIEFGRPVDQVGAHVRGCNETSIGICLVGGKPNFNFTFKQLETLRTLVNRLREKYSIAEVYGHYEKDSGKQCPMFSVEHILDEEDVMARNSTA